MRIDDKLTLLAATEDALAKRRITTVDPEEASKLVELVQEVRDLRDAAATDGPLETVATLDGLADIIEKAVAALRKAPFDAILGTYQALLDGIGDSAREVLKPQKSAAAMPERGTRDDAAGEAPGSVARRTEPGARARLKNMYDACEIRPERIKEIDRWYVEPIIKHRACYEQVGEELGIPWWFIGAIHGLESAFSFRSHLHNGDPLTAHTVNVPKDRPGLGRPPFTWRESAVDALRLRGLDDLADWSVGATLDRLERYNGLGYRTRERPSPYVWSFSRHYEKGKFVADGDFDPDAVSKQCGGATLMRRLVRKSRGTSGCKCVSPMTDWERMWTWTLPDCTGRHHGTSASRCARHGKMCGTNARSGESMRPGRTGWTDEGTR